MMRLDIFRRAEHDGMFSYLAIPEGRIIPEEAANVDWQLSDRGLEVDENTDELDALFIRRPLQQIEDKGYAISSLSHDNFPGSSRSQ